MAVERLSLGWQVAQWLERNVFVPAGPKRKTLIRFTGRQLGILQAVYTFEVVDGDLAGAQRVVDHAQLMEAKGSGKSPLLAGCAVAELCGPVVPYDIDAEGDLRGRENPDAFIALGANSEDQVKGTTWKALRPMLTGSPLEETTGVHVGKTRIEMPDERQIRYCGASDSSAEGWPVTFFGIEESAKAKRGNGGIDFIETMADNAGKARWGWTLEVTNAPELGAGSFAERTWLAERDGKPGVYVHQPRGEPIEGDIKDPENRDAVMSALVEVYGDEATRPEPEGWINLDARYRSILRTPASRGRRMYLNEIRKSEDRLVDVQVWSDLWDPGLQIPDGAEVAIGFDGSKSRDSTVMYAFDLATMHGRPVGVWKRQSDGDKDFQVPTDEVRAAFYAACDRWSVRAFVGDEAAGWREEIGDWARYLGGRAKGLDELADRKHREIFYSFPMNNKPSVVHRVVEHFETTLEAPDPGFTHDGDDTITQHVENMMLTTSKAGYKGVEKSSDALSGQIDGGVAFMLALFAAHQAKKKRPPKKSGGGMSTYERLNGKKASGESGSKADGAKKLNGLSL